MRGNNITTRGNEIEQPACLPDAGRDKEQEWRRIQRAFRLGKIKLLGCAVFESLKFITFGYNTKRYNTNE
jgi:hypothetical protein